MTFLGSQVYDEDACGHCLLQLCVRCIYYVSPYHLKAVIAAQRSMHSRFNAFSLVRSYELSWAGVTSEPLSGLKRIWNGHTWQCGEIALISLTSDKLQRIQYRRLLRGRSLPKGYREKLKITTCQTIYPSPGFRLSVSRLSMGIDYERLG
jgi:hypothetical protein